MAAILLVMYLEISPKNRHATMESAPNAVLVHQTYFKLSAYAYWAPSVAAATTASVRPGIFADANSFGAVKKMVTNCITDMSSRPALTADVPTNIGRLVVGLLAKTL
ncbi:hypothetical protein B0A48_18507 [Cryoendolithus antarcticus]|uniref:Uncharacterized protein n=1 Tax=Cryoendolithus antarcticus TaxID=1507870 RepID=A0A1V8S8F0_9PEZI|nr:hypothetical protein B0A48_18507 [Cryoendolithus antarcticus]